MAIPYVSMCYVLSKFCGLVRHWDYGDLLYYDGAPRATLPFGTSILAQLGHFLQKHRTSLSLQCCFAHPNYMARTQNMTQVSEVDSLGRST
jgi:hypothetical protein